MKKDVLENFNLSELSEEELDISGGHWLIGLGAGLLLREWESTKQAAIDLWNYDYNPPS